MRTMNIPPAFVPASAGNLLNCGITSLAGPTGYTQTQPFIVVLHVRITNNDTVQHTVSLYKGATGGSAAGTEFAFTSAVVNANDSIDWFGKQRFDATDFLTGKADAASKLTIEIDAEMGVA